eukprot:gene18513-25015_t
MSSWIQSLQVSDIFRDAKPAKHVAHDQLGVSAEYLRRLAEFTEDFFPEASTSEFVCKALLPLTAKRKARLHDFIPVELTGKPHYYVVHSWQAPFHDLINQGDSLKDVYVWLDLVALSQHQAFNATTDLSHVRELVSVCTQGALVMVDTGLSLLDRAWCLYEIWCFMYYKELMNISICLPESMTSDMLAQFLTTIQMLDIQRSKTSRPQDATRIMSEVKGSVGIKLFHKPLKEGLSLSARCALRFSREIKDVALYCLALLKCKDIRLIETMQWPGIIKCNAAKGYDTSGSGSLDEDEFAGVLATAGFTRKEALVVFAEVNTDEDDGIDYEEFESWWINVHMAEPTDGPIVKVLLVQKEPLTRNLEKMESYPTDGPIVKVLLLQKEPLKRNLEKMESYVAQMGLTEMAEQYKHWVNDIKGGKLLGDQYPEDLNSNPLRGEWEYISELCVWKISNNEIKQAAQIMYDLFRLNQDQLVHNIDLLPQVADMVDGHQLAKGPPGTSSLGPPHWDPHWDLLAELVACAYPFLFLLIQGVSSLESQLNMAVSASPKNSKKGTAFSSSTFSDFAVVRKMVALKYGSSTPITKQLIAEAEKALSKCKVAFKRGEEYSVSKDYLGSCRLSSVTQADPPPDNERPKPRVLRHEIPAEGPFRSILADLGPDAHEYLHEIADQHAGGFEHAPEYQEAILDAKAKAEQKGLVQKAVFKSKVTEIEAPSFDSLVPQSGMEQLSREYDGAFGTSSTMSLSRDGVYELRKASSISSVSDSSTTDPSSPKKNTDQRHKEVLSSAQFLDNDLGQWDSCPEFLTRSGEFSSTSAPLSKCRASVSRSASPHGKSRNCTPPSRGANMATPRHASTSGTSRNPFSKADQRGLELEMLTTPAGSSLKDFDTGLKACVSSVAEEILTPRSSAGGSTTCSSLDGWTSHPQQILISGRMDQPSPRSSAGGQKDPSTMYSSLSGRMDQPSPRSSANGQKDPSTMYSSLSGQMDQPSPRSSANGQKDPSTMYSSLSGKMDQPSPRSSAGSKERSAMSMLASPTKPGRASADTPRRTWSHAQSNRLSQELPKLDSPRSHKNLSGSSRLRLIPGPISLEMISNMAPSQSASNLILAAASDSGSDCASQSSPNLSFRTAFDSDPGYNGVSSSLHRCDTRPGASSGNSLSRLVIPTLNLAMVKSEKSAADVAPESPTQMVGSPKGRARSKLQFESFRLSPRPQISLDTPSPPTSLNPAVGSPRGRRFAGLL